MKRMLKVVIGAVIVMFALLVIVTVVTSYVLHRRFSFKLS